MITVEEWRLQMTENVERVMKRLQRAANDTSKSYTHVQDKLTGAQDKMTGSMHRMTSSARQANGMLGQAKQGKGMADGLKDGIADAIGEGGGAGAGRMAHSLLGAARFLGPAIAGAIVIGVAAKGRAALEQFAPAERELRLANLDKSPGQVADQRDSLLSLAQSRGFDPTETVRGYVSAKRASGQDGLAVEDFIGEVGEAAHAVNMPFQAMIDTTARALKTFGMPLEQAGALMDKNLKAMAVGGTTYAELMHAQEDYASAAKRTNQTLDSANAMYAVMAKYGKDAAGAGRTLSSAMEDLGKPKTVKGLEGIGVQVYDAQGQIRQMTSVVQDLVPKLRGMNDVQYSELRQQLGGKTGLRMLLDTARTSGEELLATLEKYKKVDVSMSEQLNALKTDVDQASENIENRMTTAWTRIGEGLKPLYNKIDQMRLWFAEGLADAVMPENGWDKRRKEIHNLVGTATVGKTPDRVAAMRELAAGSRVEVKKLNKMEREGWSEENLEPQRKLVSSYTEAMQAVMKEYRKPKITEKPVVVGLNTNTNTDPDPTADDTLKKGATAIVGGGKQVRNVNVTIQKLVEKLEVRTMGTVREGISNVRQQVEQALVDIVRGGEAALANG